MCTYIYASLFYIIYLYTKKSTIKSRIKKYLNRIAVVYIFSYNYTTYKNHVGCKGHRDADNIYYLYSVTNTYTTQPI